MKREGTGSNGCAVIISPVGIDRLLDPLMSTLCKSSLRRGGSFLLSGLGRGMLTSGVALVSRPRLRRTSNTHCFSDRNMTARQHPIFRGKILGACFVSACGTEGVKISPAVGSPSVLIVRANLGSLSKLMTKISRKVLIANFGKKGYGDSAKSFSCNVRKFLVRGKGLARPMSRVGIANGVLAL